MKVELIAYTPNPAEIAGVAAAICTGSDNPKASLKGALACGHDSVIEHVSFTFRISGVSRVLLAQLTRHRIASFSVQSQRYVNQGGSACVVPPSCVGRQDVVDFIYAAGALYDRLCADGVPQEDARYFLPMGGETELVMTMNARELGHFLKLRMCRRAQWEIRGLADEMHRQLVAECPQIFRRCGPGCVRGRCPEGRKSCGRPRTELMDE